MYGRFVAKPWGTEPNGGSKISNNNKNNSKIKSYIATSESNKSVTTNWCVYSSSHCADVKYTALSSTAKLL